MSEPVWNNGNTPMQRWKNVNAQRWQTHSHAFVGGFLQPAKLSQFGSTMLPWYGQKSQQRNQRKGSLYSSSPKCLCVCDLAQVWLSSGVRQLQAIQSSRQDLRRSQPHEPWHNWTMLFNVLPYWTHLCIMVQMHSLPLCIQSRAASSLTPLHWNLRSNCRSSRSVQPSSQSLYHTQDWFLAAKVVKGCQRIVKVYECHWMSILIRIDSSYFVIQVSCTGA